jgi:heterodisulfide reductase subunit A-like polyferredoxin
MSDEFVEVEPVEILSYQSLSEAKIMDSMKKLYRGHYNVITAVELEAMLNPESAFGGLLMRPEDGEIPRSIAFISISGGLRAESRRPKLDYNENLSLVHLAKLALYVKKQNPELKVRLFTDTMEVGRLPEGYTHLGEGKKVLEELGEDCVEIADLVFEEDPETKKFKITYTAGEEEESFFGDLVVIGSIFNQPL